MGNLVMQTTVFPQIQFDKEKRKSGRNKAPVAGAGGWWSVCRQHLETGCTSGRRGILGRVWRGPPLDMPRQLSPSPKLRIWGRHHAAPPRTCGRFSGTPGSAKATRSYRTLSPAC